MTEDLHSAGFKERTRLEAAQERLLSRVSPHARTESVPVDEADGRALAETVAADRPVPHYPRAAMDGYAVRAEDTFGATTRSPAVLRRGDEVDTGRTVRVHTGSELPTNADAVVMIEHVEEVGPEVEIFDAVAEGENVGPVGEDVAEGQVLFEPPHELRPSDLGLLKSSGLPSVTVHEPPSVAVIPTGEELVQTDPAPGQIVETNGQTVSQLVARWGGSPSYRDVVTDDAEALRGALERDLDHDIVVTTGGSSVGERDLVPEVVESIGEVFVHGVALKPGHPVALGLIEQTPILMLPGYPVACIVNAVCFLRAALKQAGRLPDRGHPTIRATLSRKVPSEPGTRTFARVSIDPEGDRDDPAALPTATPTRASGAGVLSSVALADGWVVVPESVEGYDAGKTVSVELWEWSA